MRSAALEPTVITTFTGVTARIDGAVLVSLSDSQQLAGLLVSRRPMPAPVLSVVAVHTGRDASQGDQMAEGSKNSTELVFPLFFAEPRLATISPDLVIHRLRLHPYGYKRMTRGQHGSLLLSL